MSARPSPFERDLRQPAHGARTSRQWAYHRPQARRPADAREWAQGFSKRRFKRTTDSLHAFPIARTFWTRLRSGRAEPEVGRRHLLRVDPRGLALPRRRHRPVRPARRSAGQPAIGFTRNWHCRLCAGPSPCGVRSPASFTHRGSQYCSLDYQAELQEERHPDFDVGKRETASITPWSRRSSRR